MTIIAWFLITVLIGFVLLIARLYQRLSRKQMLFWGFLAPILLFGLGTARYAYTDQAGGDPAGDLAWGVGGLLLIALSVFVYIRMMRQNQK